MLKKCGKGKTIFGITVDHSFSNCPKITPYFGGTKLCCYAKGKLQLSLIFLNYFSSITFSRLINIIKLGMYRDILHLLGE